MADAATQAAPIEAPIPPQAQQQFDGAVAAMGAGNLAAAEQAFQTLSSTYPTYAGPLLNLGILQAKAGKLEEARKTLTDAIGRNANSAAAFNQLGIVYRRLGRFTEADEAYQQALQIDPGYALAHLNLGVLCDLYLQQPQRALEAYERYLELAATPDSKVSGWVTELKTRLGNQPRSARSGAMKATAILMTLSVVFPLASLAAEPAAADKQKMSETAQPAAGRESADAATPTANRKQTPAATARRGDRLDLDTTVVTGNRELPKVMYIVPWKKADIGDLPAQPFNTLLDEALTPVDRDVFRREVTYYGAMSSGADSVNPASATPAAGPEK